MSITDTFFDALDKRILAGEKLGTMKHFLIDARDRFLKLEQDAQPKSGKAKGKDFAAEIERLQAELEKARAAAYDTQKRLESELKNAKAQIERLTEEKKRFRVELDASRIELAKFDEADAREDRAQPKKAVILKREAVKILETIAELGEQDVALLALNLKMKESTIQHHLNQMFDAGLLSYFSGSDGSIVWIASKDGLALIHDNAAELEQGATQEEEITRLKSEIEGLRKTLKESAPGYKIPKAKPLPEFDNPGQAILYALAQEQSPIYISDLASRCRLPPATVRYHITQFAANGLVAEVFDESFGTPMGWRLTTKGDAYVVENGLDEPPIPF